MRWGWMVLLMAGLGLLITGCGADAQREAQLKAAEAAAKKEAAAAKSNPSPAPTAGERTEQPTPPKPAEAEKKDDKPVASGDTQKLELGDRTLAVPSAWKKEDTTSAMRKAQYRIAKTGDDQKDAELAVFTLGGGLDANLKRWAGQMGGPDSQKAKKTVKTASGDEATIAEYEGSYAAMNPQTGAAGEPQEGYKMLAAYIVSGGKEYQFKLTGPAATVNAAKAGFEKMIESFK